MTTPAGIAGVGFSGLLMYLFLFAGTGRLFTSRTLNPREPQRYLLGKQVRR